MDQTKILYLALLLQLAIPIWVLLLNGKRKAADRKAGNVSPESPIDNKAWSLPVVLTSNALANQFQFPVVFYVLVLMIIQIQAVGTTIVTLALLFVLSRWIHAFVHVTSNKIPYRFGSFLVSSILLLLIFIYTAIAVIQL